MAPQGSDLKGDRGKVMDGYGKKKKKDVKR